MSKLFVDGGFKVINEKTFFCNATQCICLITAYLQSSNLSLNVVNVKSNSQNKQSLSSENQPQCGFKIPLSCFTEVLICSEKDIPSEIANCCLPAILSNNNQFVISGLCHVLRRLVKNASFGQKDGFIKLLGHKKFCLKATSEICSRTNLCEVIGPTVIDEWSHSTVIPTALLLFEKLLKEPVSIHNRDKRQRVVLKQLTESIMTGEAQSNKEPKEKVLKQSRTIMNQKLKVKTNNLPPLEHIFAEGVELTLTDLALIPLVHTFFCNHSLDSSYIYSILPNTLLWYQRIFSLSDIISAASLANVFLAVEKNEVDLSISNKCNNGKCEMLKLATTNTNSNVTMKK